MMTSRVTSRPASLCLVLLLTSGSLAACGTLPNSGPTASQIAEAEQSSDNSLGFHVVPVSQKVVDALSARAPGMMNLPVAARPEVDRIGPGDVLQITIFEVGAALFSAPSSGAATGFGLSAASIAPSAAGENLPPISVEQDGSITLPYIGRVEAASRSPAELAAQIRARLKGKSQDAQVIVTIRENVSNTIMVMGDVRKSGWLPLTLAHERLLDVIAEAGGAANLRQDTLVRVTRGGQTAEIALDDLRPDASLNIGMAPADRVELIYQPRTFTVFGATGRVSEIPFATPDLSLATALARAGGPSDQQADPTAVFVFRYETVPGAETAQQPVAYRLDLMNPSSYFLAQRFHMQRNDVIYIANARANLPTKLIQILNLFFQPVYTAKVLSQP